MGMDEIDLLRSNNRLKHGHVGAAIGLIPLVVVPDEINLVYRAAEPQEWLQQLSFFLAAIKTEAPFRSSSLVRDSV